jgi:hypothetical protein
MVNDVCDDLPQPYLASEASMTSRAGLEPGVPRKTALVQDLQMAI